MIKYIPCFYCPTDHWADLQFSRVYHGSPFRPVQTFWLCSWNYRAPGGNTRTFTADQCSVVSNEMQIQSYTFKTIKIFFHYSCIFITSSRPKHPNEESKKSLHRVIWESIHYIGGKSAILLALANISLGVFVANSRPVAWTVWFVYLGIVVMVLVVSQLLQDCLKFRKRPKDFLELVPGSENTIHNYKPKMAEGHV